jgi:ankyrin repeat protein
MTEHRELLDEMDLIENLPTQERLRRAKIRREIQLDNWKNAEYQHQHSQSHKNKKKTNLVKFQDHIMLLDAVSRKDYDEAKRLLELGVNPNLSNEDGLTSIHQVSTVTLFCQLKVFISCFLFFLN